MILGTSLFPSSFPSPFINQLSLVCSVLLGCNFHFSCTSKFTTCNLQLLVTFSCEESDSVMVLVVINGNKERIDKYCGNHTPVQLMSNGPLLMVEFRSYHQMSSMHSIASSYQSSSVTFKNQNKAFRGFKATYKFITGKLLSSFHLINFKRQSIYFVSFN